MERSAWTDERLDDMVARNGSQFELLRTELAEMRAEMRAGFADARNEMRTGFADLSQRVDNTRRDIFHGAIAIFGSLVAVFAALFAQGL